MNEGKRPEDLVPIHFLGEPIKVHFENDPLHKKTPPCPDAFTWRVKQYKIIDLINEWHDFRRRGRMAVNMQPQHAAVAEHRGSWGVGRFYFRVMTDSLQVFDIYYDRSPKSVDKRLGEWFIYRELAYKNHEE